MILPTCKNIVHVLIYTSTCSITFLLIKISGRLSNMTDGVKCFHQCHWLLQITGCSSCPAKSDGDSADVGIWIHWSGSVHVPPAMSEPRPRTREDQGMLLCKTGWEVIHPTTGNCIHETIATNLLLTATNFISLTP